MIHMYHVSNVCLHLSSFYLFGCLNSNCSKMSSNSAVFLVASTRRAAASLTARTAVKRPSLNLVHLV